MRPSGVGWPRLLFGLTLVAVSVGLTIAAAGDNVLPGDRRATVWVQAHMPGWLEPPTEFTNFIGHWEYMSVVALVVAGVLLLLRMRAEAVLVVASPTGWAANALLKRLVESPRPGEDLARVEATGFGFPSGHVMGMTVVAAVMAYVLTRNRGWRWRIAGGAGAVVTAVITGAGRVHVGAHWPSDVVGAWLWAGIWVGILLAGYLWYARRHDTNPEEGEAPSARAIRK